MPQSASPRRPILQVQPGGGETAPSWLDDEELAAIPITGRDDPAGLTRTAKAVYRARGTVNGRRVPRSYKARSTIATEIGVAETDTVWRADRELEEKGYLERDPVQSGRTVAYFLRRGVQPHGPHDAVEQPHGAVLRSSLDESALTGALSKNHRTAEPAPAGAGSAEPDYDPNARWDALTEAEQRDAREHGLRQAREIHAHLLGVDVELVGADVGPCDHRCGRTERRLHDGDLRLCLKCWSALQRARLRIESEALQADVALGESLFPMPSRVVLPPGVRV